MTPRSTLAALFLTSLLAADAHAAGLNLRWTDCLSDAGQANRNFLCNSNTGSDVLIGAFVLPAAANGVSGFVATLDLASAGATVPAWWQFFNAGACRQASGIVTGVIPLTSTHCVDYAQGQETNALAQYNVGVPGANDAEFIVTSALPLPAVQDLVAGPEYYGFTVVIRHEKTVGFGACAGCTIPACLNLKSLQFTTTAGPFPFAFTVSGPTQPGSDIVTWQGGAGVPALPGGACAGATPTRNSTWGEVKAIYR